MKFDVKSDKERLRQRFRLERKDGFLPTDFSYLAEIEEFKNAQVVASYLSVNSEPSTKELNLTLIKLGKILLLPVINGPHLNWAHWNGEQSQLDLTKKIPESNGSEYSEIEKIDLIIVPALRMDTDGYRLGQGGGYYDRVLPNLRAWKIGLVHDGELSSEKLPREEHDIALDAGATANLIVRF
jgi:5-formyltetrahydrofolate cyclo-ligase